LPDPIVIHLDVPIPALVARLSSRRHCPACGRVYNLLSQMPRHDSLCDDDGTALVLRNDDAEEVVRQRMESYHRLSRPLIEYYGGADYHRIDGQCTPERISDQIRKCIARRVKIVPRPARQRMMLPYSEPSAETP